MMKLMYQFDLLLLSMKLIIFEMQGAVARLLRSHGVLVGASPPHRQSQNGAVERQWQTACCMARSFLATARLPNRYWYWAIHEAVTRMNMLPVKSGPSVDDLGEFQEFSTDPSKDGSASRATMLSFTCSARLSKSDDPTDDPATIPSSSPSVPRICTDNKPSRRKTKFERYFQAAEKLSTPHELC